MPAPHQCMALWYLKMSHFWDLSFLQDLSVFASSFLGLLYGFKADKLWLNLLSVEGSLHQLDGEASLTIPSILVWFSENNSDCNRNISLLAKVMKGQSVPLTVLEHLQLNCSPSGTVPLLLGFLKWLPFWKLWELTRWDISSRKILQMCKGNHVSTS